MENVNQAALDTLIYWIQERESMRFKKEISREPRPWTKDPYMATYRWCNVHRENDRVTRWIAENWRDNHLRDPYLAISMAIARLVNWPETLDELGYPKGGWSPEYRSHFIHVINQRQKSGAKAWTGAYMVTGGYSKGGETKEQIIARVIDGIAPKAAEVAPGMSLAEAANTLLSPGLGSFLVGQVIADLKYTPLLDDAADWYTWCTPGPGSTIGLNFIHNRERRVVLNQTNFMNEVNEVREYIDNKLGMVLHAQDTQNCLCEFHKYWRAKELGEALKTRYVPGRGS
jgi:hypothetical protein